MKPQAALGDALAALLAGGLPLGSAGLAGCPGLGAGRGAGTGLGVGPGVGVGVGAGAGLPPQSPAAPQADAARRHPPARMPLDRPHHDAELQIAPLWRRAQAGDEAAYREALQRIGQRLRAYLRRRLASRPDEVEDLLQETLLALHLQRGSCDPAVPVTAWVLAIARHKLVDHWRRHGRQGALHERLDEVDEDALGSVDGQAGEARRDLGRLLQTLPAAQRRAIELTKLDGWSVAEAAQQAGVSESALKVQVHRGLKRLAVWVRRTAPDADPPTAQPEPAGDAAP